MGDGVSTEALDPKGQSASGFKTSYRFAHRPERKTGSTFPHDALSVTWRGRTLLSIKIVQA
jgi:hypothetical protein